MYDPYHSSQKFKYHEPLELRRERFHNDLDQFGILRRDEGFLNRPLIEPRPMMQSGPQRMIIGGVGMTVLGGLP